MRVTCDGDCVTVKEASTEAGLDTAADCFNSTSFDMSGGHIGFMTDDGGNYAAAGNLKVKYWDGSNWVPDTQDAFDSTYATGYYYVGKPAHDAAGRCASWRARTRLLPRTRRACDATAAQATSSTTGSSNSPTTPGTEGPA